MSNSNNIFDVAFLYALFAANSARRSPLELAARLAALPTTNYD